MKNFPFYRQLDQMDCGPACLRMIAKYYGRTYTSQFLRDKSQISKDGVSLMGISEAAEAIGFRTMGVKIPLSKLLTEVQCPCILHWNQNHFVVLIDIKRRRNGWLSFIKGGRKSQHFNEKFSEEILDPFFNESIDYEKDFLENVNLNYLQLDKIEINSLGSRFVFSIADPAKGKITISTDDFVKHWFSDYINGEGEGVILLLEPTPIFFDRENDSKTDYGFGRVFVYLWQYKYLLLQLAIGLIVGSGLQLIFPFLTQSIVDVGVNSQNISFVYLMLGAQLMLMAGRLSVEFIRSWILLHISTRINLSILSDFLIKLMRLPVSFFDSKHYGDLLQRMGDHHRIENFLTGQMISVLFSMINLLIFGFVLAMYSYVILSVLVISSILYGVWVVLFLGQRRSLDYKRFDVSAKNQSSFVQLIQGMHEIKLAGAERTMRWSWERLQIRIFHLQMKGLALNQYQQAGAFAINETKNIIITFLAAQSVIEGQLSLGAMLAVQQIIGQLNSPIEQLISFTQGLQDAKISLERLNEIHSLEDEEPVERPLIREWISGRAFSGTSTSKNLKLRNLSFRYTGAGNELVLKNINLLIPEGKTTAIVGMSGSGKTTLLKLLLKFYEPTSGEIRLGETALHNVAQSLWRSQCGVVMQDGFIFSDSIARNIAIGVERIDPLQLEHAVRVSNLNEFIDALPAGLHTKIGAEGNGISQGQRQRILIARAVYKNPQFIFFDEATNALDANNESIIMQHLNKFFHGRTVIVVAHRLSTVNQADQIVVLNKGQITEVGTHSILISNQGDYWQLVKNQLELND